jgi:N6-adenosine-specific RNA methylase IME4
VGELTPEERKAYYHKCKNDEKIPSLGGLYAFWRNKDHGDSETPSLPEGKFCVIYADPPWKYDFSQSDSRKIENQYPTMELDAICNLPIANMASDDCVLFLWATSPKLVEAMQVVFAWGFTYKTCAVWVKDKIGMGYYFRQRHELLLVATKGNPSPPPPSERPDSVMEYPRGEHSAKPPEVQDLIDGMYPDLSKVELFARNNDRKGWVTWGNQA